MDTIILDDGIEYAIVKDLEINGITYTLFANINDQEDICFRKTVTENDGEKYYIGLDDEKELDLVMMKFSKELLNEIKE